MVLFIGQTLKCSRESFQLLDKLTSNRVTTVKRQHPYLNSSSRRHYHEYFLCPFFKLRFQLRWIEISNQENPI